MMMNMETLFEIEDRYRSDDYLGSLSTMMDDESSSSSNNNISMLFDDVVDGQCRSIMGRWCYSIAKLCGYSRRTVHVALNTVDRVLSVAAASTVSTAAKNKKNKDANVEDETSLQLQLLRSLLLDRNQFQLLIMTCLYTAVKIHERQVMTPKLISSLSRGQHTPDAITAMELLVLKVVTYRVNPAPSIDFVTEFLQRQQQQQYDQQQQHASSSSLTKLIAELTERQIDSVALEYEFSFTNPSRIAAAALLNSIETACYPQVINNDLYDMATDILQQFGIDTTVDKMAGIDVLRKRIADHVNADNNTTTNTTSGNSKSKASSSKSQKIVEIRCAASSTITTTKTTFKNDALSQKRRRRCSSSSSSSESSSTCSLSSSSSTTNSLSSSSTYSNEDHNNDDERHQNHHHNQEKQQLQQPSSRSSSTTIIATTTNTEEATTTTTTSSSQQKSPRSIVTSHAAQAA